MSLLAELLHLLHSPGRGLHLLVALVLASERGLIETPRTMPAAPSSAQREPLLPGAILPEQRPGERNKAGQINIRRGRNSPRRLPGSLVAVQALGPLAHHTNGCPETARAAPACILLAINLRMGSKTVLLPSARPRKQREFPQLPTRYRDTTERAPPIHRSGFGDHLHRHSLAHLADGVARFVRVPLLVMIVALLSKGIRGHRPKDLSKLLCNRGVLSPMRPPEHEGNV